MLSLHVDSTIATPCYTVLPTHYSGGCSPYTERCCPPDHGYTATGSHHSGSERPALAIPVRHRVDYKLALLVYKSLHGLAPPYLADDCILASSDKFCRRLRSADVDTCIVPRTRTRFGDRSFSAAGHRIWNSLPPDVRRPDIELGEFRRLLKIFCLFRDSRDGGALVTL